MQLIVIPFASRYLDPSQRRKYAIGVYVEGNFLFEGLLGEPGYACQVVATEAYVILDIALSPCKTWIVTASACPPQ